MVSPSPASESTSSEAKANYRPATVIVGAGSIGIAVIVRSRRVDIAPVIGAIVPMPPLTVYSVMSPMTAMRTKISSSTYIGRFCARI